MASVNYADVSKQLGFALGLAERAGTLALEYFQRGVEVSLKSDNSPVTVADKECEQLIRAEINKQFPDDLVFGEEEGLAEQAAINTSKPPRKWLVDPIDGTYNFARQIPIFSLLIALEEDNEIILGVIHNPALNHTYYAEKGSGTFLNGKRIFVSEISQLEESCFAFGGPSRIVEAGYWPQLTEIVRRTYRQRALGDYLNFGYVLEGKVEANLEVGLQPWDLAPMKILVEEAGGKFSDLEGGSSIYTGKCLATNLLLHDTLLQILTGKPANRQIS